MIKNILKAVSGYAIYRGGAGHFAFIMHRISGIATLLFLSMHILLESTARFAPQLYEKFNTGLRNPFALAAEILMAFLVIFHSVNGFRIAYCDLFMTEAWSRGRKLILASWVISIILWLPAFALMILHDLNLI